MVFHTSLKKGVMIKKAGPLSGKTEMAAKVAQVTCAIFFKQCYGWNLLLYYCSYKSEILGHGRALWAAHVHQISAFSFTGRVVCEQP